jgi:DNA-binding CsgD family transcriptional regulator
MRDKNEPSPIPDIGMLNHQSDPALSPPFGLTEREKEVLKLFVDGLTYKQIARQLNISRSTVGTHLANSYRKLGVTNRVQALRQVIEHSLL